MPQAKNSTPQSRAVHSSPSPSQLCSIIQLHSLANAGQECCILEHVMQVFAGAQQSKWRYNWHLRTLSNSAVDGASGGLLVMVRCAGGA